MYNYTIEIQLNGDLRGGIEMFYWRKYCFFLFETNTIKVVFFYLKQLQSEMRETMANYK